MDFIQTFTNASVCRDLYLAQPPVRCMSDLGGRISWVGRWLSLPLQPLHRHLDLGAPSSENSQSILDILCASSTCVKALKVICRFK